MTCRRTLLAGIATLVVAPLTRAAQPAKVPRVGLLLPGSRSDWGELVDLFRQRLRELGYVDGQNIHLEERYADDNPLRMTDLARELAAAKVDVVVAAALAATRAVREATQTIPIVMVHGGHAPAIYETLSRPGGNVTGTVSMTSDLGEKHVEILRELVPRATRIAILANHANPGIQIYVETTERMARRLGIEVVVANVARIEDFPIAFDVIRAASPGALAVPTDPLIWGQRAQIIAFAANVRIPALYSSAPVARDGGLISYSTDFAAHYPIAADYVNKILKGARPADLPIQQPTKLELVINLKTARALRLTIPQSLLVRADELIQ
jgi:putative ABC transport system substrate-binding protein